MHIDVAQELTYSLAGILTDASPGGHGSAAADHRSLARQQADEPPVVFVVEDDPYVRDALVRLIERTGWRAETFESAQEFLRRPLSDAASCLVLDTTLPGLSGLAVQAMKAGPPAFLVKPFNDDALMGAIVGAIERSR